MRDKSEVKHIFKESLALLGISLIAAFLANFLSPNGIPLFGEWDVNRGVVTADPQGGPVDRELEIGSVELAKEYYDRGAVFLDARSSGAYAEGHVKGAVSIPINEFENVIEDFTKKYAPETFFVTYCSGRECEDSHVLAQKLFERGYWEVSVFIDGFPAWESMGFPIEKND